MFEIDFSGGAILSEKGKTYQAPGEVLFKADGAKAQASRPRQDGEAERGHVLDGHEATSLHKRLLSIYRQELERQAENRVEMAVDEDMYDHIQWTAEELATLKERGQHPLVFNLIQTTINWVLGTQRRTETDYKILPRRKDGLEAAQRKDELLRHVRDENHSLEARAHAFSDAVKAGIGWLETGEGDPSDGPIVFDRAESWRNMLWDSKNATSLDLQDSRFMFRTKWLDLDIASALWPERKGLLAMSREGRLMSAAVDGVEVPLRIPMSNTPPVISRNGTLDNQNTEYVQYAFTWVTSLGEETGPSPLSNIIQVSPGNTVDVGNMPTTVPVPDRFITKKRIYRSVTGSSGVADLYFVAEINATDPTFIHNMTTHPPAEALPTKLYGPAPTNLRGLTMLPNGIMAGFAGKQLCFSDPYLPHSWPGTYRLTVDNPIIGLAAFGTTLAVLTTGNPYLVQGLTPDAMAMQKMEQPFPCMSKDGIVDMGYSAIYPSTDGLVMVSEQGAQLISKGIWTREQWLAMQPTTFVAARFGTQYGFTYTPPAGGPGKHLIFIDPSAPQSGITRAAEQPRSLYTHVESGKTYWLASGGFVVRAFDAPGEPKRNYRWRSKPIRLDFPTGYGAIRIDTYGEPGETCEARVFADGNLIRTLTKTNSDQRLPAGKYQNWQIELFGTATVIRATIAQTFEELNG